jgi:multidrug efflux pump subunit AcrA (membrane-fusion protein)
VPTSAVLERKGRPTVFVMTGGESFVRRDVELGVRDGEWVGITSGVEPGARVVSRGSYFVKLAGAQTGAVGHHH